MTFKGVVGDTEVGKGIRVGFILPDVSPQRWVDGAPCCKRDVLREREPHPEGNGAFSTGEGWG